MAYINVKNDDSEQMDLFKHLEEIVRSQEVYPVDFDEAWKWVGYSTKQKALEMLKFNFQEGSEFLTLGVKTSPPEGSSPSKEIKLTKECFKSFCMVAQTDKGKEVRKHYLEVENKFLQITQPKNKAHALLQMSKMLSEHLEILVEHEDKLAEHDEKIAELASGFKGIQKTVMQISSPQSSSGNTGFMTISGYASSRGNHLSAEEAKNFGKFVSRICKQRSIDIKDVPDERWGKVKSYPIQVLDELWYQRSKCA